MDFKQEKEIAEFWEKEKIYKFEISEKIDKIELIDPITRNIIREQEDAWFFPAKHYVVSPDLRTRALTTIRKEVDEVLIKTEKIRNMALRTGHGFTVYIFDTLLMLFDSKTVPEQRDSPAAA